MPIRHKKLLGFISICTALIFLFGCGSQEPGTASETDRANKVTTPEGLDISHNFQMYKDPETGCEYLVSSGATTTITPRWEYGNRIRGCRP